jgi:hypothetical protein
MRTPRGKRPNDHDLAKLKVAHAILLDLMRELAPATPEHRSLENAYDAVRTAAIDWTGNPYIWSSSDGAGRPGAPTGWVKRPEHEK